MLHIQSLANLCHFTKGTYPTLKTEPGKYPLVVTASYRRTASTYQMEGPAVCIPLVSSTGHGDAALHRVHYQDGKFALANLLVALTARDPALLSIAYLYHLLMAKKDDLLVPLMQGTANVSLRIEDIAQVQISLPSIEEQRQIVAHIEAIAEKVDQARLAVRQASTEADGLIAARSRELFNALSNQWPLKTFQDFNAEVTSGPRNWSQYITDDGLRFYRAQDLTADFQIDASSKCFISPPANGQGTAARLRPDDLLIVITGATVGRCARYMPGLEPGFVSQHVATCRFRLRGLDPAFAWWALRSPIGQEQLLNNSADFRK